MQLNRGFDRSGVVTASVSSQARTSKPMAAG